MEIKEYYEAPQVTVIEVEVEKGFAQSLGGDNELEAGGDDMVWG